MNIQDILTRATEVRIAVVGDYIKDQYIIGEVNRISPEAPVPVVKVTKKWESAGGAGNVAANLFNLGVNVSCFYGDNIAVKTRVMAGSHHIVRIDEEDQFDPMHYDDFDIGLDYGIMYRKYECVVISDYGKGTMSESVASTIITKCRNAGIPVVVDTKTNFDWYAGASVVKCNFNEYSKWSGERTYRSLLPSAHKMPTEYNIDSFIITNGEHGMSLYYRGGSEGTIPLSTPAPGIIIKGYPVDVCDPCGAGDTVTAIIGLIKSIGFAMLDGCELANIAASEVCKHPGVTPITKDLLTKRYKEVYGIR